MDRRKLLTTSTGERFSAPALIVATGASWRKLNVPGEADYIGKGVAFALTAMVRSIKVST